MKLSNFAAAWVLVLWAACSCSWVAAARPHRHSQHRSFQSARRADAAHLERLAAQEKRAWRLHLAKLRSLPRRKRLTMIRHDHRYKHDVAAQHEAHEAHLVRLAAKEKAAWRLHLAKLHARQDHDRRLAEEIHHDRRVDALQAAHQARVAALQATQHRLLIAHDAKLTVHEANVQAHEMRLARQQAIHLARVRLREQTLAARLAARRAHWVALHSGGRGRSIRFWQVRAAGVPVKCITVDLNDAHIKVSALMARRGDGTAEPFGQMIRRADPNVAVTGTFFSLDNLQPIGDIVVDGSLIHFGGMGTALCITPDNRARMVECQWGRHHDWSPYDFVVACGPRLLRRGRIVLDPAAERFRDRHMLAPNSRIAVGITPGNKLIFVMTHEPISLGRLAWVMRDVGASEAMNLDAGTSTGFYYNGDVFAHPGRKLTNLIVVYRRKRQYERELPQLVPATYRRMSDHYGETRISAARGIRRVSVSHLAAETHG